MVHILPTKGIQVVMEVLVDVEFGELAAFMADSERGVPGEYVVESERILSSIVERVVIFIYCIRDE